MSRGTVAFLTTGIPDRTLGGSGIFNDLICRRLLADGYEVHAIFRVSDWFLDGFVRHDRLDELKSLGLRYELLVQEDSQLPRLSSGMELLETVHHFALCELAAEQRRSLLESASGIVALDLGWAWALAPVERPRVAVLGDPHFRRMSAMRPLSVRDRGSWSTKARQLAVERALRGPVRRRLASYDDQSASLASFSPLHAAEYRRSGINVRHARWFVPGPILPARRPLRDPFRLLHVGSLETSASRSMLDLWEQELLPALSRLPFDVDLRLVGPTDVPAALAAPPRNVRITAAGFVPDESLEVEYAQAAAFLSPMPYPIGVRTRIVSALAHAVPVLAHPSARGGLPELQVDKEIVYAATGRELADALSRLHGDPHYAEQIGAAGRAAWERLFSPDRNVPALLALAGLGDATSEAMQLVAEPELVERRPELG